MSFTTGALHSPFPIDDASRVGEARRHAARLAVQCSMDDTAAGRLAIVVTELGTNLLRHARGGRLLIAGDAAQVEVIAIDDGPGMADTRLSMNDGFSTGGTSGNGLGAVRRLSQDFHMHSVPGEGTVIVARVASGSAPRAKRGIRYGGVATSAPGEIVSGDAWAVASEGPAATLFVADGLGHGAFANQAAREAIDAFRGQPVAQPREIIEVVHGALRSTRGAAVAALRADSTTETIDFCGAGNIIGRVVSGVTDRTMITQNGTAGLQVRRPEQHRVEWAAHAAIVVHSDGIESRWTPERVRAVLGRDPVLMAAIVMRDHCRGRDDATVVVLTREAQA
ncbi:MAG TPA: ATP-binding SpoIIE family protein phosphatase [Ramlibacter sp.]|nr:ATP-binding SpoIIE family protein phosphatase [Ramlibacter sp.]